MLVVKNIEGWANNHQQRWHSEALQKFGERVVVRHRWNIEDFAAGLVGRCYECSADVKVNEQQRVRVVGATGGTFTLTFAGQTTDPIPFDASAVELNNALSGLEIIADDDLFISGENYTEISGYGYTIEFRGQWAYANNIPLLTANSSYLAPSGASVEITQIQQSSGSASIRARTEEIYKQSGDRWCSSCYGIGFEGGYEPVIYVTYALISDQQEETTRNKSGVIQKADPTAQFSFEPRVQEFDIIARVKSWANYSTPSEVKGRYILKEVKPQTLRTGPGTPDNTLSFTPEDIASPTISTAKNELLISQECGIEIVPYDDPINSVPLTPTEELILESGILQERTFHKKVEAEVPIDPRMTEPL